MASLFSFSIQWSNTRGVYCLFHRLPATTKKVSIRSPMAIMRQCQTHHEAEQHLFHCQRHLTTGHLNWDNSSVLRCQLRSDEMGVALIAVQWMRITVLHNLRHGGLRSIKWLKFDQCTRHRERVINWNRLCPLHYHRHKLSLSPIRSTTNDSRWAPI